jgi:metal-sulfur cluster biosynthetic enzyme
MAAIIITQNPVLTQRAIETLKRRYDSETLVNMWELGLIYELNTAKENNLTMIMTLTWPSCAAAETFLPETE